MDKFKTNLKTLLEKERLTLWDVGQLFQSIGGMFTEFENSILMDTECTIQDANTMLVKAKEMAERLSIFYDTYDKQSEQLYEKADETLSKLREIHTKLQKRIDQIPPIECKLFNTYQVKELCDLASRFSEIPEHAWNRVIDLAKALKQ